MAQTPVALGHAVTPRFGKWGAPHLPRPTASSCVALCQRWTEFLVDGYDTLGENWGNGTHVHAWSSTPTKDLIFYTLGVAPAEPSYTVARIAPRLGRLAWAKGSVPTPHGLIHVEVSGQELTVDSPVPVVVDLPGREKFSLGAGKHVI